MKALSSLGRTVVCALALAVAVISAGAQAASPRRGLDGAASTTSVVSLQADAASDPLGIDDLRPRLTWRLFARQRDVVQRGYDLIVSSTRRRALAGRADVWNTGSVSSGESGLVYAGRALRPFTRYWWTVRIWDQDGRVTRWAKPAWFETAFTRPSQWTAAWIRGPQYVPPAACSQSGASVRSCTAPSPLLRTVFKVSSAVRSARLYASGLGYGTYFIDGARVGKAVLSPGFTDYNKRAFYVTRDVTKMLRRGLNALGAELGRGPFGEVGSNYSGYQSASWHAEPELRLELHITYRGGRTQVIRSSPRWRTTDGPIRFDDYMMGETYDAQRAAALRGWSEPRYDDSRWTAARLARGPAGVPQADDGPPIIPGSRTLPFRSVKRLGPGDYLFDLGRNIAGNAILDGHLTAGQTLTLHYGEKLDASGHVDTTGGGQSDPIQTDIYRARSGRNVWRPEFSYKGFQYVEVTGLTAAPPLTFLRAQIWHADLPVIGSWTSSNDLLNRIYAASRSSILSNTFSIPTDTPIYEKTGYTGDGQLVSGADSYMFDMRRFYAKWSEDIRETVASNGAEPIIAPSPTEPGNPDVGPLGFHGPSPGWNVALFDVPNAVRLFGGDSRPEIQSLPEMQRVMSYYQSQAQSGLLFGTCVVPGLSQPCYNGLGDWSHPTVANCAPLGGAPDAGGCQTIASSNTEGFPGTSVDSNSWWAEMLRIEALPARLSGDAEVAAAAEQQRTELIQRFNQVFENPATGTYHDPASPPGDFSQHENAMPLGLGLVPVSKRQAVGDALAADASSRADHLTTGIMGTRFLFDALTQTGHVDEAYKIATQTTYPSYGYWLDALGWTGLGEQWEPTARSRNHQMFGSIVQWFYADLAGIKPLSPGWGTISFEPFIPRGLNDVSASTNTVRGRVAIHWHLASSELALTASVPPNATGLVYLPAVDPSKVTEGGMPASTAPDVRFIGRAGNRLVYRIPSGTYTFDVAGAASE